MTIIIGGMIRNRKSVSKTQVPLLGSIPLLGRLFRYDTVSSVNAETIVFLTPKIVLGDKPHQLQRDIKKEPKPLRSVRGSGRAAKPIR